jgi:membrane protease subunit (stomatin/prohibitin family)
MTGAMASGLEAAGKNEGGAMLGFAGMAMGMNAAGAMGVMPGQQPQSPQQQNPSVPPPPKAGLGTGWTCTNCGNQMPDGTAFCAKCGSKKPVEERSASKDEWVCSCGNRNVGGKFCPHCGKKRPEDNRWVCSCGNESEAPFCSQCGNKKPDGSNGTEDK